MYKYVALVSLVDVIGPAYADLSQMSEESCAEIVNKEFESTERLEKRYKEKIAINGVTVEALRAIQKNEGSCKALKKIQNPDQ